MKTAAWIIVAFIAVGIMSSGVVRRPDGTVDVPATVDAGARKGGEIAGDTADNVGNSIGHSIGSAVDSSDLAKVGVAGGAAAGVAKYGPKITRPSINPKPVTEPALTPTTEPPKRRTGWCTDVVTGAVMPCDPIGKTEESTPTTSPEPMEAVPFEAPHATLKPCRPMQSVDLPGMVLDC